MRLPRLRRRRATRLAELIDQAAQEPQRHHPDDADLTHLTHLVDRLRTIRDDDHAPRPEFARDLRARLMHIGHRDGIGTNDTANRVGAGEPTTASRRRPPARRYAITAATALITAIAVAGTIEAANRAVPGDALYTIKRDAEDTQLALAGSDVDKGTLELAFARIRLSEADAVTGDDPEVVHVLADMDAETRDGVRLLTTAAVNRHNIELLATVDRFVADQRAMMPDVVSDITGYARARADVSAQLLTRITARITGLRADFACIAATSPVDGLGPRPVQCTTGATGLPPAPSPAPSATSLAAPPATPSPAADPTGPPPAPTTTRPPPAAAAPPTPKPSPSETIPDAISSMVQGGGQPQADAPPGPAVPLLSVDITTD